MNSITNEIFFRSPGKLLITGEYLVLHGAEALSLPVSFGQSLRIKPVQGLPALLWKTIVVNKIWFEASLSIPELNIINTSNTSIALNLRTLLLNTRHFNPDFLTKNERLEAISELDYDISWGLGSSSSLTVNISRWAGINPFDLHFKTFDGSGFDVASCLAAKPIVYRLKNKLPEYNELNFKPPFMDKIWFVYLELKKNTSSAIKTFKKSRKNILNNDIEKISNITRNIIKSNDLKMFISYLQEHDSIIARLTGFLPLSEKEFGNFNGYAKYLGAWGGDFAMIVSTDPSEYISTWLMKRGFKTCFHFGEIIMA